MSVDIVAFRTPWTNFKAFVQDRHLSIQWLDMDNNYYLFAIDGIFRLSCLIPKEDSPAADSNQKDFEDNFKAAGNQSFSDIDGTDVMRIKASKKGWTFAILPIETVTAEIDACISSLCDGTLRSYVTQKIYDADDVEITTEEGEVNAVKTVIDFEPNYDYELIGGQLQQLEKPTTPVRVWVVAVPDIAAPTGSKEMIGGVNLEFIDPADKINADGRVSKYLAYNATYHTNKLRIILKHSAGIQHRVLILLEIFRA